MSVNSDDSSFNSDQSGDDFNWNNEVLNFRPEIVQYRRFYLLCRTCRSLLFPVHEALNNFEAIKWFWIDPTVVAFDETSTTWRCRRCSAALSSGIPNEEIVQQLRSGICVLALGCTETILAALNRIIF